LNLKSAKHFN